VRILLTGVTGVVGRAVARQLLAAGYAVSGIAGPDGGSPQKPVGTAAAEAPDTSGVAASQPAGVAVAPAKQHRVRTIMLKTGAIIGVAVAVGAVVALSAGTSSKPPGAH